MYIWHTDSSSYSDCEIKTIKDILVIVHVHRFFRRYDIHNL